MTNITSLPRSRVTRLADDRPLWRVFVRFLGPMVVGNVLQALSGTFNSIFVGQMLGTKSYAAAAAVFRSSSSSSRS